MTFPAYKLDYCKESSRMILGALFRHSALLTFADRSYLTRLRSQGESTQLPQTVQ